MPSLAGATKARKSDGAMYEGTARTPNITPSNSGESAFTEDDEALR
jgi:hypothetical protein